MCGIVGWAGPSGPDPARLSAMVAAIRHRGPDEAGYWEGPFAHLGIARLSIIDVAGGHQPVFSSDKSIVAVLNGEIYNYRELAAQLRSQGTRLGSKSDAEVIPHLYGKHGVEFVSLLRGMFSIALWDSRDRRLLLVRDRVGKKPLVYAHQGDHLYFGSEARALFASGWRADPDFSALDHVLAFGHVPINGGALQGLRQVPPGHILEFHGDQTRVTRYWQWRPAPRKQPLNQALGDVKEALDEAVRVRLVSERPLGVFLSGGIDSTLVAALMARHQSGPVRSFSIGFEEAKHDESPHARRVAAFLGTEHHELIVKPNPTDVVERVAQAFDQPFADSSALPTLLLSEFAAQSVVVALAGDGGDEAFGGYVRYLAAAWLQRFNSLLTPARIVRPALHSVAERTDKRRLDRLAGALVPRPSLGDRYLGVMTLVGPELRRRLWATDTLQASSQSSPESAFLSTWKELEPLDSIAHMRAMDMAFYLPGDLLAKVDVASMSQSLEVRSPLLDQKVLELAAQLPSEFLMRQRTTKWLLREIAYDLVPRDLIDRPKQGFAIPRASWLRGPLRSMMHDLLLDDTARARGWFNQNEIAALIKEHDQGTDRDMQLWPLLMIEAWARHWVDK